MRRTTTKTTKDQKASSRASAGEGGTASCRCGETTYAMGWLKWGPTVHWWIRRREDAVETAYREHC
jgi:hypothetical protein